MCNPPLDAHAGLKLAVVSNFDTRLRPLLSGLGISRLFDAIIVSAEVESLFASKIFMRTHQQHIPHECCCLAQVGVEKPNPGIFEHACGLLGVEPREAVHVGDDRR